MPPQIDNQIELENKLMGEKPKRSHLYLIILTILLIATGAFAVWYYSNPLPEEMSEITRVDKFADWQTYRNEEYGFEFKYPNGWTLIEGTSGAENYDLSVNYIESTGIPAPSYCQAKLSTDKKRCEGFNTDTGESTIVDWDYSMVDIHHKTNGNYISIWFKEGKNDEQHKSEIRLVLSTFKYISTSTPPIINTSGWKIAGGDIFGFTMLVPLSTKQDSIYNPLTEPHGDFYVENSTKNSADYFYLVLSKELDFVLDRSWKEENINFNGVYDTVLIQKNAEYNRVLIEFEGRKLYGLANKDAGWALLLKVLESFKKL